MLVPFVSSLAVQPSHCLQEELGSTGGEHFYAIFYLANCSSACAGHQLYHLAGTVSLHSRSS